MTVMPDEREIVLNILTEHEINKTYSNILVKEALDKYPELPLTQRSFIKRLTEGTIERQIELDTVIRRHLSNPSAKIKPSVRCLLRMSIYQIFYMDSVPDHAVVDEAVKLLKKRNLPQVTGFVNAVLRGVCRDKAAREKGTAIVVTMKDGSAKTIYKKTKAAALPAADEARRTPKDTDSKGLSKIYSMPLEIVEMWEEDYGKEETAALLEALLKIRPVTIRFDDRISEEEAEQTLDKIRAMGVHVEKGRWLPKVFFLSHMPRIQELPGFNEGVFTVQDESSMMVCYAAGLAGDKRPKEPVILDLCAAPGGKSMHAASLAPDGKVYSFDISKEKTDKIRDNVKRMHLDNVIISEHDACRYDPELKDCADVVLCDLPCSGLGVVTKKRDIKYNVTMAGISSLTALQKRILKNAVEYVKPGGVLIYSTCTIDKRENEKIADYIEKKLGLVPDDLKPYLPEGLPRIKGGRIQFMPHVHGTDGFFIARFIRPE